MLLERQRIRELFDLRRNFLDLTGGDYVDDPYLAFHRLREAGPVHEGTVHGLLGYERDAVFQGLPFPHRRHFSAFDFATCDAVLRDPATFASSPPGAAAKPGTLDGSMLGMGGAEHRRHRGLVQPSFVPARARWWVDRWIGATASALVDQFAGDGCAELNVDFCAAIPVLTITGSFGVDVGDALDIREALVTTADGVATFRRIVDPIVAARRRAPQDDLVSVLTTACLQEPDGATHALSDDEILSFSFLLLAAGSGTTWKQMGILLTALLRDPAVLGAVRADETLLVRAVEESLRWNATDPMFSRFATRDVELAGVAVPEGSVVHCCLGAANRDPSRWSDPDRFDPGRPPLPHLAFGTGPHVCLGMHVARAEMVTGVQTLLDRLPNLRLDDRAVPPAVIGLYERGVDAIPVVFEAQHPASPERQEHR